MAGKTKSDAQKKKAAADEREKLYQRAIDAYDAEQRKPDGEPRDGLRAVCRRIERFHHEETGRFISIDHSTVSRRWNGGRSIHEFNESKCLTTPEESRLLVKYAVELAIRGFPLDYKRLSEHANELLSARLGPDFPGVGENWPRRFVERFSDDLDMCWSRSLDVQRGRAVNPTANDAYWRLVDDVFTRTAVQPKNIYAADEIAFTTAHETRQRVIGPRKKVATVQHQQRGGNRENITVMPVISAAGVALEPLVIYKGEHFQVSWKQNNPLKAAYACSRMWIYPANLSHRLGHSKKGWITGEISVEWIKHFDAQTRATADGATRLLFVDGHVTHYTRAFLEYAKSVNIEILCYPAHATHVYQGLDVVLFGPLKTAFGQERDRWEREEHEQVSKKNFLAVYGRAHLRTMSANNICAAFRKTGLWPFNPDVITAEMLAPSRETSAQAHMPLPQPTPVRKLASMLRLFDDRTIQAAAARSSPPAAPPYPQPRDDWPIDPILLTTPYRARAPAAAHARNPGPIPAPVMHPPLMGHPTPRTALRTTSAGFLVQPENITSGMALPRAHVVIPPEWSAPQDLFAAEPQSLLEWRLQETLRVAAQVHDQQLAACYTANAGMVLQRSYCERVRGQLAASERKSKQQKGQKLMGDGMPRLLTDAEFMQRVADHQDAQLRTEVEKQRRAEDRARYQTDMEAWKKQEEARKQRNEHTKAEWKKRVAEWEAARALAKEEGRRFGVRKPVRGPLEKAVPKPRARALPDVQEDEAEDFGDAFRAESGEDSDEE